MKAIAAPNMRATKRHRNEAKLAIPNVEAPNMRATKRHRNEAKLAIPNVEAPTTRATKRHRNEAKLAIPNVEAPTTRATKRHRNEAKLAIPNVEAPTTRATKRHRNEAKLAIPNVEAPTTRATKRHRNESKLAIPNVEAPTTRATKRHRNEAKLAIPNVEAPTTRQRLILSRCQHKEKKSVQKERPSNKKKKKRKLMDAHHHQATRIHFKDELIVDILSKLPVHSLLRFKCISKFWKTLISEPYFKMKHQSHAMNFKKLLVGQWCLRTSSIFRFYSSPLSSTQLVEDVELVCPENYESSRYKVWCSYNGLVLLSVGKHILLWNPSTRESMKLPYSKTRMGWPSYGLGYDTSSDDYKVLKYNHNHMEILALKSGCWRKILYNEGFHLLPMCKPYIDPFAFVHGTFHWVGCQDILYIVSLSISDEVCGIIQLLEPMSKIVDDCNHKYGVAVLREMLCFYCAHTPSEETTCKLWVMKAYGIKESWIQLYTIRETGMYLNRPLHMFDDGEILLSYTFKIRGPLSTLKGPFCPLRTSKGPYGLGCLWSVDDDAIRKAITYSESMISPKLLI